MIQFLLYDWLLLTGQDKQSIVRDEGPSTSILTDADAEELFGDDDDDELDIDELNELEATLSKTSIHIKN